MKRTLSKALVHFSISQVTLVALITVGLLNTIASTSHAQPAPASPDRASQFWVPAARLDPSKTQRITIVNKTGIPLEYLVTTHTDSRILDVGNSVTLSDISTPLFLNINSQESNYFVQYSVSVDKKTNTLMVTVALTNNEDSRVININETGAVYLY